MRRRSPPQASRIRCGPSQGACWIASRVGRSSALIEAQANPRYGWAVAKSKPKAKLVSFLGSEARLATATGAQAIGTQFRGSAAIGALAIGAAAIGGFAIGRLTVKQLAIGRATIGRLAIRHLAVEELEIGKLTIRDGAPPSPAAPGDQS